MQCLFENATKSSTDEMNEIRNVLGPKSNDESFLFAFYRHYRKVFDRKNWAMASNMFKMVDWMKIGDKIQQINPG